MSNTKITPEQFTEYLEENRYLDSEFLDDLSPLAKGNLFMSAYWIATIEDGNHFIKLDAHARVNAKIELEETLVPSREEFVENLIAETSKVARHGLLSLAEAYYEVACSEPGGHDVKIH